MILTKSELKKILVMSCKGLPDIFNIKTRSGPVVLSKAAPKGMHSVDLDTLDDFSDKDGNVNPVIEGFLTNYGITINYPKGRKNIFTNLIEDIESRQRPDEENLFRVVTSMEENCVMLSKVLGYAVTMSRTKPKDWK